MGLTWPIICSSRATRWCALARDAQIADLSRLERLGIAADVESVSLALNGFCSVLRVVSSAQPQDIYNLAGRTSVGLSFDLQVECMESFSVAALNLLEVIRYLGGGIRFFSPDSS